MGIRVETRTGDTSAYKKNRQKILPPHMLMTTPESLALLLSNKESKNYFKDLKYLIIDEIHVLVNSKRGDLLSLNLSRIHSISPDCKRIGLSATVKNKETVLKFLTSKNKAKILKTKIHIILKFSLLKKKDTNSKRNN